MQQPPIKLIRRLLLLVIVGVTLVSLGTYAVRRWRLQEARRRAPATLPEDVEQQIEKFTFSRSEAGRTLFTVEADRSIERAGEKIVLEAVKIVIYGKNGERADEIQTGRCTYDGGQTGEIECPGEVRIVLHGFPGEAAAGEAPGVSMNGWLEVETSDLRFDTAAGVAWTDRPVRFRFSAGKGEAVGLRYQPQEPTVVLKKDVWFESARPGGSSLRVSGDGLQYNARDRTFLLLASGAGRPAKLQWEGAELQAGRLRLALDPAFHTERVEAGGGVVFSQQRGDRVWELRAETLTAKYSATGRAEQVRAQGAVRVTARSRLSSERLSAREVTLRFDPSGYRLQRATARGDAVLVSEAGGTKRQLRGEWLELVLSSGAEEGFLLRAPGGGELLLTERSGKETVLAARQFEMEFRQARLRALRASDQVHAQQTRPDAEARVTSSDELRMSFDAAGEVVSVEQWGSFQYQDADRQAQAGRARYRAAGSVFVLEESPFVSDANGRTTADTLEFREEEKILLARGHVRTTLQAAKNDLFGSSGGPVYLAAAEMEVSLQEGWTRYREQARLWQGKNRLAADLIELRQASRQLLAEGNVSARLLETAGTGAAAGRPPRFLVINARQFSYRESERLAVFTQDVTARSRNGVLRAPRLEIHLAGDGGRVESAHATGGVRFQRDTLRIESGEADYDVAAGTVVFGGGQVTIHEERFGRTTAARLTLFLADDRLLAESAEGVRTITRRPRIQ